MTPLSAAAQPRVRDPSSPVQEDQAALARAQLKKRILELATTLPSAARDLQPAAGRGFAGHAMVERIIALIERPCVLVIRRQTDTEAAANG